MLLKNPGWQRSEDFWNMARRPPSVPGAEDVPLCSSGGDQGWWSAMVLRIPCAPEICRLC